MTHEVTESIEELLHSGYRYALSLSQEKALAEDVLQEAWLAVLKANGPKQRGYLFSAIRSRFLNIRKREQLVPIVSIEEVTELEHSYNDTEIRLDIEYSKLENALNSLRSVEREALFLLAVEGYTANEIATFTDQPRGTVLSHIHRAKHKIRRFFQSNDAEVAS